MCLLFFKHYFELVLKVANTILLVKTVFRTKRTGFVQVKYLHKERPNVNLLNIIIFYFITKSLAQELITKKTTKILACLDNVIFAV